MLRCPISLRQRRSASLQLLEAALCWQPPALLLQQAGRAAAVACAALPAEDTSAAAAVSELTAAAGSLAAVASRSFESAEAEAAATAVAAAASGHVAAGAAQQFVMILARVVPENGRRQPDGAMCMTSGDCAYTAWLVHYREGAAGLSLQWRTVSIWVSKNRC